jgi:hypothetical protein
MACSSSVKNRPYPSPISLYINHLSFWYHCHVLTIILFCDDSLCVLIVYTHMCKNICSKDKYSKVSQWTNHTVCIDKLIQYAIYLYFHILNQYDLAYIYIYTPSRQGLEIHFIYLQYDRVLYKHIHTINIPDTVPLIVFYQQFLYHEKYFFTLLCLCILK